MSWTRVGAACGFVAGASYALVLAAPATSALGLVAASVFGPALVGFSAGLYHVLRAHRRTVTVDFALMANVAAGVTVTLMLFSQLALNQWFELRFGTGSTDSSERVLRAGFEAANGIQLGLDLAWDLFLALGVVLLAWNMLAPPTIRTPVRRLRSCDRGRLYRSESDRVPRTAGTLWFDRSRAGHRAGT